MTIVIVIQFSSQEQVQWERLYSVSVREQYKTLMTRNRTRTKTLKLNLRHQAKNLQNKKKKKIHRRKIMITKLCKSTLITLKKLKVQRIRLQERKRAIISNWRIWDLDAQQYSCQISETESLYLIRKISNSLKLSLIFAVRDTATLPWNDVSPYLTSQRNFWLI